MSSALVVGLPMTVVALIAPHDDPRTPQTTTAACALIGWIRLQLLVLRELSWVQPVCDLGRGQWGYRRLHV
ncbi:hypothetical protein ACWF82_22770 [Nocardia sp. NPDC055053]